MVGPAVAVAADVPVAGGNRRRRGRVRLERLCAAEDRDRQPETGENAVEAPEADPGAIFEHAFSGEIAAGHTQIPAEHLGQPALGDAVPTRVGELGPFLEIDDEIDGDAGVAGPLGMRRLGAVTYEIACHLASDCGFCGCERMTDVSSRAARRVISATGADSISKTAPRMTKLA